MFIYMFVGILIGDYGTVIDCRNVICGGFDLYTRSGGKYLFVHTKDFYLGIIFYLFMICIICFMP